MSGPSVFGSGGGDGSGDGYGYGDGDGYGDCSGFGGDGSGYDEKAHEND